MTGREELVARLELEALRPTSRWEPEPAPAVGPSMAAQVREVVELVAMVARTSAPAPASTVVLATRRAPHAAPAAFRRRRSA